MSREQIVSIHQETGNASYASYLVGFSLSLLLTLAAYITVASHLFTTHVAFGVIAGLATVQFVVQLICFLHLGFESKPRWKLLVFWFMLLVVFIIVVGTIWIMANLNYHMLQGDQLRTYMQTHEGI